MEKTFSPGSFVFQLRAVMDPEKATKKESVDISHQAPPTYRLNKQTDFALKKSLADLVRIKLYGIALS